MRIGNGALETFAGTEGFHLARFACGRTAPVAATLVQITRPGDSTLLVLSILLEKTIWITGEAKNASSQRSEHRVHEITVGALG